MPAEPIPTSPSLDRTDRLCGNAFPWALTVSAAYAFVHFAFADIHTMIAAGIPDDATYYFKMAQFFAAGKGLTFDGLHATSGFHPLWLLMLYPLYRFVPGSPELLLRLSFILQIALMTAAGAAVFTVHRSYFSGRVGLVSAMLFLFLLYFRALNGMESPILVFMLAATFYYSWRARVFAEDRPGAELATGLLLGLVTLARLDMAFLPLLVCLALAARAVATPARRASASRKCLMIGLGVAIVVLPYFAYNQLSFGSVMPISGAIKSSFPHVKPLSLIKAHVRLFAVHTLFAGLAALYLLSYLIGALRGRAASDDRGFYRASMAFMAGAVVMHFLYTMLFMKWAVFGWYFIPYALLTPLLVSEAVEAMLAWRIMRGAGGLAYWIMIALLAVVGARRVYRTNFWPANASWHVVAYDTALWMREHTPPDAVFAMADAGHIAYFGERSVINLDGIANNRELQDVIRRRELGRYLKENHAQFLAHYQFRDYPSVSDGTYKTVALRYPSQLYDCMSEPIVLKRTDEVYRSPLYREQPGQPLTSLVIWRLPND